MFRATPRLAGAATQALISRPPLPIPIPLHTKPLYTSVLDANLHLPADWDRELDLEEIGGPLDDSGDRHKGDQTEMKKVESEKSGKQFVVDFKPTTGPITWTQRLVPTFLKPQVGTTWYERERNTHISPASIDVNGDGNYSDTTTHLGHMLASSAPRTTMPSLLQRVIYGTPEHILEASLATVSTTSTSAILAPRHQGLWHRLLHGVPEADLHAELGFGGTFKSVAAVKEAVASSTTTTTVDTTSTTAAVVQETGVEVEEKMSKFEQHGTGGKVLEVENSTTTTTTTAKVLQEVVVLKN